MAEPKLTIPRINKEDLYGCTIRLTNKADALLQDIADRSGRTKRFIASKMIEFAYQYVAIAGEQHGDEDA